MSARCTPIRSAHDRWVATRVLLVAVLLAGCGSSGSSPAATDRPAPPVVVVADDYSYRPATLSTTLPVSVRVDNAGTLAHTWTVVSTPIERELDLVPGLVIAEATTEPGQSATIDLAGLAPGTYQVVCAIPGHISAGMVGELVIRGS
ncbi:MAG: hypothetical protein HKN44_02170 [Ilumatobacter sp.]|nr:hypothetical protein [Ilumatobacter sp.]